jgi:cytidine deaminase
MTRRTTETGLPPDPGEDLEALAREAQRSAYAPYSRFRVGAAVLMSGELFRGANIENASYGLGVCAERTAVFSAVLAGAHRLEAVAVCTDASPPSSPCGACRQVLCEFAPDPAQVTVTAINPRGERRSWTLAELLPDGFSGRELAATVAPAGDRPDGGGRSDG